MAPEVASAVSSASTYLTRPSLESFERVTIALRCLWPTRSASVFGGRRVHDLCHPPASRCAAASGTRQRTAPTKGGRGCPARRRGLVTSADGDAPAGREARDAAAAGVTRTAPAMRHVGPSLQRCTVRMTAMWASRAEAPAVLGRLRRRCLRRPELVHEQRHLFERHLRRHAGRGQHNVRRRLTTVRAGMRVRAACVPARPWATRRPATTGTTAPPPTCARAGCAPARRWPTAPPATTRTPAPALTPAKPGSAAARPWPTGPHATTAATARRRTAVRRGHAAGRRRRAAPHARTTATPAAPTDATRAGGAFTPSPPPAPPARPRPRLARAP